MTKFEEVYAINVNDKIEERDGLSYLSWAPAWAEFKRVYPDAVYDVERDEDGRCYFGDEDVGYMVYTAVLAGGIRHTMWLPVLDGANKAMKRKAYTYQVKNKNFKYATLNKNDGKYYDKYGNEQTEYTEKTVEAISSFEVNKAIMRCLTKNLAMFGLGLYVYAGEDLPDNAGDEQAGKNKPNFAPKSNEKQKSVPPLTKAEMVEKWGIKNVEETLIWFESKFKVQWKDWTDEHFEAARGVLEQRKAKRESEAAKMREGLQSADAELPFNVKE